MAFAAQDVHRKILEITADDSAFALRDFDVDGELVKGFVNAPGEPQRDNVTSFDAVLARE
jgi:hypothetical protein